MPRRGADLFIGSAGTNNCYAIILRTRSGQKVSKLTFCLQPLLRSEPTVRSCLVRKAEKIQSRCSGLSLAGSAGKSISLCSITNLKPSNSGLSIKYNRLDTRPSLLYLAGSAGFEPANAGTKTQCLTTWRRPNRSYGALLEHPHCHYTTVSVS